MKKIYLGLMSALLSIACSMIPPIVASNPADNVHKTPPRDVSPAEVASQDYNSCIMMHIQSHTSKKTTSDTEMVNSAVGACEDLLNKYAYAEAIARHKIMGGRLGRPITDGLVKQIADELRQTYLPKAQQMVTDFRSKRMPSGR